MQDLAAKDIEKIAKTKVGREDGNCYHQIILLGYSNGGHAVYQVAKQLRAKGIKIDLVITADPI